MHDSKEKDGIPKDEALPFKSPLNVEVLNYTSPVEPSKYSTSLFTKMKSLLANTIGDTKKAREFFGIHKAISTRMMKFEIYKDDKANFEALAYRALLITVMATKKKQIRNLPGYFKGVLDQLVEDTYFSDMFMLFDKPAEFYHPKNS